FFEFIPVDSDDEIVVLHEIGVLRIDANANIRWSIDCDVIENSVVDDQGRLLVSTIEGARLAISLQSGAMSHLA
ncbi:MAG TPA: hypothetical protein VLM79_33880, partial [Kofleriaceae bacterium]|nr:hypothetical protein [Kofleriaceae bacterium]